MGNNIDLQNVIKAVDWLIFDRQAKNRRELAEKLGYTESSFSQILNGKVAVSSRFIKKILDFDNRLNPDWFTVGQEPMLKPANNPSSAPILDNAREERLLSIIESQQRTIERLSEYLNLKH